MLIGLSSPLFVALAAGVIAVDLIVFYNYGRASAEFDEFYEDYHGPLVLTYTELINGIDLLRAFGKVSNPKNSIFKQCYNFSSYKMSKKFLEMGMNLLLELTSLAIIAGAAFFAVHSKFDELGIEQNVAILGTSIAVSIKLTGLVPSVGWAISAFKSGVAGSIATAYSIINQEHEEGYDGPEPPASWPNNSSITFKDVTLQQKTSAQPEVNSICLEVNDSERIYVTGRSKGGMEEVLGGCSKELTPIKNYDLTLGSIEIGGINLLNIGRKYVPRQVAVLFSSPFMITGTLRENIDPFGRYSD